MNLPWYGGVEAQAISVWPSPESPQFLFASKVHWSQFLDSQQTPTPTLVSSFQTASYVDDWNIFLAPRAEDIDDIIQ